MDDLPAYGLANTVTGFATFGSGAMALVFSRLMQPQPLRWRFAYWLIVITGVFTVTLHGFGETLGGPGPRWVWAALDTGSNIVVAWGLALAVLGDYYAVETQRRGGAALTLVMVVGVVWHVYDRMPSTPSGYLIPLGTWGGFNPGETWLIALSWVVVGLFVARRTRIPPQAMSLLWLVIALFFCGMLMATASNSQITYPFFAWHALWHLVGACGFLALWAFNHTRFSA